MLVLDYYIACLKWPSVPPAHHKYLSTVLFQLSLMNWKDSTSEYMKYVSFMIILVDRYL